MKTKTCELCKGEASLYCVSDSAFLCWNCDSRVHEANFLVARHVRCTICHKCNGFDGNRISGVGNSPCRSTCKSCVTNSDDISSDSSSSSTCVSTIESSVTTTTKKTKKRTKKVYSSSVSGEDLRFQTRNRRRVVSQAAEGVLVNWCMKLGLNSNSNGVLIQLALDAFDVCIRKLTVLPFRVNLSAALWYSMKGLGSTCRNLKRFEGVCGVPAKLVLLAEKKMERVLKMEDKDGDLEEGWAECSD